MAQRGGYTLDIPKFRSVHELPILLKNKENASILERAPVIIKQQLSNAKTC